MWQAMAVKVLVAVCNPSLIKCLVRSVAATGAVRVVPKGHVARVVLLLGQLGKQGACACAYECACADLLWLP